uniref:restriction endonuclease subunit S n=1 Tax=uncultured Prevotella sp. TaxID=159272 RepID=UPI002610CDE9
VALFINAISLVDYVTGTAQPKMNQEKMNSILLAIPPVKEQHRILEKMSMVDAFIDKYASLQAKLNSLDNSVYELLRKSILQEAIQGKLVPQIAEEGTAQELLEQIKTEKQKLVKEGKLKKSALNDSVIFRGDDNKYYEKVGKKCLDITDEIPFEIPESWTWSRLSSMCSIVNGFTPLRSETKFWDNGTINWFTVEDIKNQGELIHSTKQKITKEATSKERIVRAGSVLLCCTASIGQCALAMVELTTNQQFNALTVTEYNKPMLADNYLFWYAKTLKPTLKRLSGKTTFEFVSVKKVGSILIPIPPFKEQQRIVAQIEKLFEQLH